MARIYSDSILESFAECRAKGKDALGPRFGKVGPARQGQAAHAFVERYIPHLWEKKLPSDIEEGRRLWNSLRWQLTPNDEDGIHDDVLRFIEQEHHWILAARERPIAEIRRFYTLDRQEVPPDRVNALDQPIFAMTADLEWVDDMPNILDWKWGRVISHLESPTQRRQQRRYCAARFPNAERVRPHIYHGRHCLMESPRVGEEFTREDLEEFWNVHVVTPIRELEAMQDGWDERCVGAHCVHCDIRQGCGPYARAPWEPTEAATSSELFALYAISQKKRDDMHAIIRERVDREGVLVAGKLETTISTTESLSFEDKPALEEALRKYLPEEMIQWVFRATKSSVERVLQKAQISPADRAGIMEELRPLARIRASTRLGIRHIHYGRDDGGEERTDE